MRKAAALAVAAVALASGAAVAPMAHAAGTICVALVVDFRALGGSVSTTCATVSSGATGYDVLSAAGHRLGFRSDGLVCTIDGLPREGCSATDGTHYWAYWHRQPGSSSWDYSDSGGGSYHPANRSTEGWVWQNGGAQGSRQPDDVPYTSICRPTPSPTPRPVRTTTAASPRPAAAPRTLAAPVTATTPPGTRTPVATASPAGPASRAASSPPPSGTAAAAAASPAASATTTADPAVSLQARSKGGGDRGVPVAPVVGVLLVAGVAVAAGLRFRRGGRGTG